VFFELKPYDKIHKISYRRKEDGSFQVACAAGRELLCLDIVGNSFKLGFITKFSDWISSVSILADGSIVILTAHNLAALLKISDNKAVIVEKLRCEENSTLYCSFIHGREWKEVLFFGGTALGELVVWRRGEDNEATIVFRQFLHNGVIFCIDYDEEFLVSSLEIEKLPQFRQMSDNFSSISPSTAHIK
jgi:hypothetical protein